MLKEKKEFSPEIITLPNGSGDFLVEEVRIYEADQTGKERDMAEVIGYVPLGQALVRATAYIFGVRKVIPSISEDGKRCEEEVIAPPRSVWDVLNRPWEEYDII